jgi:hypothetical protein
MRARLFGLFALLPPNFRARQRHRLDTRVSCNGLQYALRHRTFENISTNPSPLFTDREHEPYARKTRPAVTTPHLVRTAAQKRQTTQHGRLRFKATVLDLGEERNSDSDPGTCKRWHMYNSPGAEVLIAVGQCRQDDAPVQTEGTLAPTNLDRETPGSRIHRRREEDLLSHRT